jgi:hypothetical protein
MRPSVYLRRIQLRLAKSFQKWMANRKTGQRVYKGECSRFPLRRIGVTKVYGSDDFVQRVRTALETLKIFYPFGYSLVQRYVHSVIESDVKPEMGITMGVLYERTAPNSPFAAGPARYAAYMVRRAVGQRQSLGFAVRSSPRALAAILKREAHAMALVRCDSTYIRYIRAQIQQLERTPSFPYSKKIKRHYRDIKAVLKQLLAFTLLW